MTAVEIEENSSNIIYGLQIYVHVFRICSYMLFYTLYNLDKY